MKFLKCEIHDVFFRKIWPLLSEVTLITSIVKLKGQCAQCSALGYKMDN